MTNTYTAGDGRIWIQRSKFVAYELLLPYGMTGVTDPVGGLTPIREPSVSTRRLSVIADIVRGEPGLPEFQIETRLKKTLNLMLELKKCAINVQVHMGACDRPDNYVSSEMMLHWERAMRGDLTIDRMAKIEGDNVPVGIAVPWSARSGPLPVDFQVEFLSARTIAETEAILGMAFLESECFEDCKSQEGAGENGYVVTGVLAGSPLNISNVWYTEDYGETWNETSARPFVGGEAVSDVVALGIKRNHRVVVARGTADAGNPAEIAYADVTTMGTVTWVYANVGAINGQYITKLLWPDYRHMYAVTNDGYVYLSVNGGVTWTAVLSTAVNQLNGVAAVTWGENAGIVWVVGNLNTIYMSEDYGTSWTAVTGPSAGNNLTALALTPDGTVFVGDSVGAIYGSYDNGLSWTSLPAQGIVPTNVDALACWGDSVIWAAVTTADGGRVVRSVDGGAAFRLWTLNIPANGGLNALFPVDINIVYAAGEPYGGTAFITRTKSNLLG